jgi:hypothetical protein
MPEAKRILNLGRLRLEDVASGGPFSGSASPTSGYANGPETCRGSLIHRIVTAKPKARCSAGHPIDWQAGRVKATMLPF